MKISQATLATLSIALLSTLMGGAIPATFATSAANCTQFNCNLHNVSLDLGPLGVNPCNGQPVSTDVTVTNANLQMHSSADGSHVTATIEGTFSFTQSNGVTYSGHGMDWFVFNANQGGTLTSTGTTNLNLSGSDGTSLIINAVTHFTMTPDGTITVSIASFNCH